MKSEIFNLWYNGHGDADRGDVWWDGLWQCYDINGNDHGDASHGKGGHGYISYGGGLWCLWRYVYGVYDGAAIVMPL